MADDRRRRMRAMASDISRPQQSQPHSALWKAALRGFTGYVEHQTELPPSEVAWLFSMSRTRSLGRGDIFCEIGQTKHEIGFVEEGILQVYTISPDGTKVVLDFVFPGQFAFALAAVIQSTPSQVCFEAVTECLLHVWPYEIRQVAFARHHGWVQFDSSATEDALLRKTQRVLALNTQSARQRYEEMARDLPPEWRDIPQHLIASYLNITPEYLSRLRRAEARRRPE
jgi:CRP-like cAMP-binding protein